MGFDAVRAVAVVAVVVLHALVPYLKHPMPGLVWSVSVMDEPSALADGVFWSIELFVMPLFLVIAGFFCLWDICQKGSRGTGVQSREAFAASIAFWACRDYPS